MPLLGQAACQPVGSTACPPGFEADPSGWGCRDVLPSAPCTGATIAVLGKTTCQPLGDCAAAFPPAGATHFVDLAGPVDATHFRSVAAALAAAPAGAVIAVAAGEYRETLVAERPVKLVGRCPQLSRLVGPGIIEAGLLVGSKGVEVDGLAFIGHQYALDLMPGTQVTVSRSLIEGSFGTGILIDQVGASLKLVGSVVRGTLPAGAPDGMGVLALNACSVEIVDSVFEGNVGAGLYVGQAGAVAKVSGSVIRDTAVDTTGRFGYGINVNHGASLSLTGSALVGNHRSGLIVQDADTLVTVTGSVVRGTRNDTSVTYSVGVRVLAGARLALTHSQVTDTNGPSVAAIDPGTEVRVKDSVLGFNTLSTDGDFGQGLYVMDQAAAYVDDSALVQNHAEALSVTGAGATALVSRSILAGTQGIVQGFTSMGLGVGVVEGAEAQLADSALVDNQHSGLYAGTNARASLVLCVVLNTRIEKNLKGLGHGVFVQLDSVVEVTSSVVRSNAGIGLVFAESAGAVRGSYIADNPVGLHAQGGSEITAVETVPATVGPRAVVVSNDTAFVGNATRLGTGTVALPPPPVFKAPK
jgi:hypothetical protein